MGLSQKKLVQRQLLDLGFPLAGPYEDRHLPPPVFNGETVRFGQQAVRAGITPESMAALIRSTIADHCLKTKRPSLVVVVPWNRRDDAGGRVLSETVFPVTDSEVIRYQLVTVRPAQARFLGACEDGMFYEADADDLVPWTGPLVRRAA